MITPSDAQAAAIRRIVEWYRDPRAPQEFYLAGYAGTGKSTSAAIVIGEIGARTITATFTGKAASVLRRKGVSARTIHSLIYVPVPGSDPIRFTLSEESDLWDADLLVVDEVSLVPDDIVDDLRGFGKKILVLGDPGQLPPIKGAGAFTCREPDVFLTEIHRQAAESPILRLATAARRGEHLPYQDLGEAVVRQVNAEDVHLADHQVICGVHRRRWKITSLIRERRGHLTVIPEAGERVICRKNSRDRGLFNGAMGTTSATARPQGRIVHLSVEMDDAAGTIRTYPTTPRLFREHREGKLPEEPYRREIEAFDFGYCLTCHSAQGSEWDNVVVVDDSASFGEDRNRWLYTAITRASRRLILLR